MDMPLKRHMNTTSVMASPLLVSAGLLIPQSGISRHIDRAASRPDSLLTLAGPPTSDRAPCFEEPSTAGPGPGPKHALHAHSPLAQPPPLRRGEWNRMIQAASLPPSARMDADNHRVPGAHQRITSREANARSTSCEAHTSWTRRASHAIPTATVTTPGRCLPSDFEDASSLVPAEERPEHSGPQRSMLEKRPKPGPSQPVSGTKPARAKRERPQGNRVEPRPRQRKRTKKGTARAEADKAKEPSCKAKAHVGRPERIACEDPEAGGSGGVLAMEVSPARMPIRLQRSPAPSTTPLACDPGLTGSTEVDAACLQAERNAPSSKYFKRFPADQTETPDLSLPAHAPGNSPEYAGGGVGDDAPLFGMRAIPPRSWCSDRKLIIGEQHRACPTQNTGARAEVPFGIAALRGAGPSDEDESPHGNPARQSESYDDNLSRKNAAEPEEDEYVPSFHNTADEALTAISTGRPAQDLLPVTMHSRRSPLLSRAQVSRSLDTRRCSPCSVCSARSQADDAGVMRSQ